jgi:flavin-dependent dehydrogenase
MTAPRPIEIIGGGLAGLGLGLGLRAHGVPVIIREAGTYPRHRVCGEFITALDGPTRRDLQLDPCLQTSRPAHGVTWHESGLPSLHHCLPEPALCLSRHRLDLAMAEAFTAAGGRLETGRRAETAPAPGRVLACGRRPDTASPWIGLKQHFHGLALTDDLELHLGDGAYVGLTRVEEDTVNVCGLFPRAAGGGTLATKCRQAGLTQLSDRLAEAVAVEDSFCAVAGLDYHRPTLTKGAVSLGDHHGLIPPFTGHGMTIAWQSAAVALPALVDWSHHCSDWESTAGKIQRHLAQRFRRRIAWGRRLHPWLLRPRRRRVIHALHRTRLLPFHPLYRLLH